MICQGESSDAISRSYDWRSFSPAMLPEVSAGVIMHTSISATAAISRNRLLPIVRPLLRSDDEESAMAV